MTVDEKDEALLAALERNARASVVDLARRIGLSRSATQERLARLERTGAIAGYTIRRGAAPAGTRLRAWLMVRHAGDGDCTRVLGPLRRFPEVISVDALAGDPDLLVAVEVAGPTDLDRVTAAVKALPGIGTVSTHVVLARHPSG